MGRRSGIREFNGCLIIGQQSIHQYPNYWFSSDLHKVTKTKWQFLLQKVFLSVFFLGPLVIMNAWICGSYRENWRGETHVERNGHQSYKWLCADYSVWDDFFSTNIHFHRCAKNHVQLFFRKVLKVLENFWDFMHFLSYRFISVYE